MCIVVLTSGCSGILQGDERPTTDENTTNNSKSKTNNTETTNSDNLSNGNIRQNNTTSGESSYFNSVFKSTVANMSINVEKMSTKDNILYMYYQGNFTNESRTISDLTYITAIFAGVVNKSYHNNSNWNVTRLNVVGISSNGSTVWDFRTEDWWAMNYIQGQWDLDDFINATLTSGHHWNVSAQRPEPGGVEYLGKFRDRLQNQTEAEVISLNKHGAEAFLTYETNHDLNSSQYFDEVANVVDVYKNLTLPRSLNRTDGWYAGVLNIEIRNGNDTLEWYRYRIRWAEERVRGEMTREEEAGRLRLSRFLEKDRLRDEPHE
jgi:hypothetical protein